MIYIIYHFSWVFACAGVYEIKNKHCKSSFPNAESQERLSKTNKMNLKLQIALSSSDADLQWQVHFKRREPSPTQSAYVKRIDRQMLCFNVRWHWSAGSTERGKSGCYSLLLCLCLFQTLMKNICKISHCQKKCKNVIFMLLSNNSKVQKKKNRGNTCLNVCNTYCYLSSKDNKGSNKSGSVKSLIIWCPIKILFITRVVNNALSSSGLSVDI